MEATTTVKAIVLTWLLLDVPNTCVIAEVERSNKLIVKFSKKPESGGIECATKGVQLHFHGKALGLSVLEVSGGSTGLQSQDLVNCTDIVECVEDDIHINLHGYANDKRYGEQWNLKKVGANRAWNATTGSQKVVVAVIDTGVDYNHPDLWDNMWVNEGEVPGNGIDDDGNGYVDDVYGYDFKNNDGDPFDDHGHGTHCAGIVGAVGNNGKGIVGVNHHVSIMACKFMDKFGGGSLSDAVKCLDYALEMGAHITSNSYGHNQYSKCMDVALKEVEKRGQLFVAASGNEGENNDDVPSFPASYNNSIVVAVGASDAKDDLMYFSNYGAHSVDILAPGHNILSTVPGGYRTDTGTSMAAPHVAGAAALLLAAAGGQLTGQQLKQSILGHVDSFPQLQARVQTGGRLNIVKAMQSLPPLPLPISPSFYEVKARPVPETGGIAQHFQTRFNLGFSSLVLQSSGDVPGREIPRYSVCQTPLTTLPVPPTNHKRIFFKRNDESVKVVLKGGARFPFFNQSFSSFFVNTNGQITFGHGYASYDPTISNHFNAKRISALFTDLEPLRRGRVTWAQQTDRAIVTWLDVDTTFFRGRNTFQVELFWNGTIRMNWLRVDAFNAIVGISDGTFSPLFKEAYFTEAPHCGFIPAPPKLVIDRMSVHEVFSGTDRSETSREISIVNGGESDLEVLFLPKTQSWSGNILFPHYWLNPIHQYDHSFAENSDPCSMGYCTHFNVAQGKLMLTGSAALSPRLVSPLQPPFRIRCHLSRTRLANNHFLAITTNPLLRWPVQRKGSEDVTLFWEMNAVYAQSSLKRSLNQVCHDQVGKLGGDHNITVEFGVTSVAFHISGCGPLSIPHAAGSRPLYIYIGADCRLAGCDSWWNNFEVLDTESIQYRETPTAASPHNPSSPIFLPIHSPEPPSVTTSGPLDDLSWLRVGQGAVDVPPHGSTNLEIQYKTTGLDFGRHVGFVYGITTDPNVPQLVVPVSFTILGCPDTDWAIPGGPPVFGNFSVTSTTTPPNVPGTTSDSSIIGSPFGGATSVTEWNPLRPDGFFAFDASFNKAVPLLHPAHFVVENGRITTVTRLDGCSRFLVEGEIQQMDPWVHQTTPLTVSIPFDTVAGASGDYFPQSNTASIPFDHRPLGEFYAGMGSSTSTMGITTSSNFTMAILVFTEVVTGVTRDAFSVRPASATKEGGVALVKQIPDFPCYYKLLINFEEGYFGKVEVAMEGVVRDSRGQESFPILPMVIHRVRRVLLETTAFRLVPSQGMECVEEPC